MQENFINLNTLKGDVMAAHLFSDSYNYFGKYKVNTFIQLTQYNKDAVINSDLPDDVASYRDLVRPDCINWFHVTGLADSERITRLLREFNFFTVDVKAILTPCHAAKIDIFKNRLLVVMESCYFEKKQEFTSEHICIIAKDNIVMTFKERDYIRYDNVLQALRKNTMNIRQETGGMLIAFLLNAVLSVTIGSAMLVESMLEKIDDILLDARHNRLDVGKRIQECRRVNLIIQKNSIPLRTEFNKLLNSYLLTENHALTPVYRELYNQLDFIILTSGNSKELLASMRDLYVSNNELRMNAVVKRLTVVATLFIPITFWVGVWGMNFSFMPELNWKYGYLFAWFILLATGIGTWLYMKKNKWY